MAIIYTQWYILVCCVIQCVVTNTSSSVNPEHKGFEISDYHDTAMMSLTCRAALLHDVSPVTSVNHLYSLDLECKDLHSGKKSRVIASLKSHGESSGVRF